MATAGYWYVELDDGGSGARHTKINGTTLEVGELVPHAHGRTWRIDRVDQDSRYATRCRLMNSPPIRRRPVRRPWE